MKAALRVAVASWSSRRVGGIEEYLSLVIPALHSAGIATAFWHELDGPADRPRIALPPEVTQLCAAKAGLEPALKALSDWRPDVIYIQGMLDAGIERRLIQIAPSIRFLHTYSGTCISGGKAFTRPTVTPCHRVFGWPCLLHYFPHGCGGLSPVTMWRQFQRQTDQLATLRHYTNILTHTAHMQAEMARHGLHADVLPFPVDRETTCSPGLPPSRATADHRSLGEGGQPCHTTANGNRWRLLYAGRMDFLKGGRFLLDALPLVAAATDRPVTLTLAGDGPERGDLEARARELAGPKVTSRFSGWVSHDHVGALMRESDLLVVPSVWPEPFGSVGPAAAQYGLPAAAYAVGGISDWLTDGVTGHLAPGRPPTAAGLAKAIVRCLEDPEHYNLLRLGARQMADRFTMAHHLPELIARFEHSAGRS